MARNFIKIDEWEIWVPDLPLLEPNEKYPTANTERELYKLDPNEALSFEIRHLSKAELRSYQDMAQSFMLRGDMKDVDIQQAKKMFTENVRNIKNYSIGGVPIVTGSDLYDRGEPLICNDISRALVSRSSLEAGLAKKLKSPSASTISQVKASADGAVQDAIVP